MTQEHLEGQLAEIRKAQIEFATVQGGTTAALTALNGTLASICHAQEICQQNCQTHRTEIWAHEAEQDKQLTAIQVSAAGETATNKTKWGTIAFLVTLIIGTGVNLWAVIQATGACHTLHK